MADVPNVGPDQGSEAPAVEINFFKPHTPFAKENMRFISVLVVIWAVAVFGFQFLLIALQQPTPEPIHSQYQQVWGTIEAGNASPAQAQVFARATLRVLGKNVAVKPEHKALLSKALSATVVGLLPAGQQGAYATEVAKPRKGGAVEMAISAIGLEDKGFDKLMRDLLPTSLVAVEGKALAADLKTGIPGIMDLYLIHNQSFLTDFVFLGFPFHYWFTAQFLLILFVLLCLIYAKRIDKIMIKHGRMKAGEA